MTTPVLELKDVNKAFGGVQAVRDMSFAIGSGELAGLIGPNGAGKTTIFNLVTGVYDVTSGAISFKGQSLNKLKTGDPPRHRPYLPEPPSLRGFDGP